MIDVDGRLVKVGSKIKLNVYLQDCGQFWMLNISVESTFPSREIAFLPWPVGALSWFMLRTFGPKESVFIFSFLNNLLFAFVKIELS